MEPYQKATEELLRRQKQPENLIKTGLGATSAIAGGASIFGKIMPLLSKYVPEDIVIKGISKINPTIGKAIKSALGHGYQMNEIEEFFGEKNKSSPDEKGNIIQQYSPELFQFINDQIKKGLNPIQAGALAQNDKKFSSIIQKLSKDHKTPWSNIISSVFGNQEQEKNSESKAALQQPGPGQQALMETLQKINQRLGG